MLAYWNNSTQTDRTHHLDTFIWRWSTETESVFVLILYCWMLEGTKYQFYSFWFDQNGSRTHNLCKYIVHVYTSPMTYTLTITSLWCLVSYRYEISFTQLTRHDTNSCINTICIQCVLDTTLCDKICQWLATGRWFSPSTPVYSTSKTDHHEIAEILLKVTLTTINPKQ